MIVYLALHTWDYSPYMSATILGVYSSEVLAKQCCQSHSERYEDEKHSPLDWRDARDDTRNYHDLITESANNDYGISQFELDKLHDWKKS